MTGPSDCDASAGGGKKIKKVVNVPCDVEPGASDSFRFNIMVAGESGLGKTTFLNTLLQEIGIEFDAERNPPQKTSRIMELALVEKKDIKGVKSIMFGIYDTPGYGDLVNNQPSFDLIKDDLSRRHRLWLEDNDIWTSNIEGDIGLRDTRIHMCLYFIAPHRMKDIDNDFIQQLAPFVTIVPVIAKADTMTIGERNRYLAEVKLRIFQIRLEFRRVSSQDDEAVFQFDEEWSDEDFARLEAKTSPVPEMSSQTIYAIGSALTSTKEGTNNLSAEIMESSSVDTSIAESVAEPVDEFSVDPSAVEAAPKFPNIFAVVSDPTGEREYPWGKLNVKNIHHSDFLLLRDRIFLKGNITKFKADANKKTKAFRNRMLNQTLLEKVSSKALETSFSELSFTFLSWFSITCIAAVLYGSLSPAWIFWLLALTTVFAAATLEEALWARYAKVLAWLNSSKLTLLLNRVLLFLVSVGLMFFFFKFQFNAMINPLLTVPSNLASVSDL